VTKHSSSVTPLLFLGSAMSEDCTKSTQDEELFDRTGRSSTKCALASE
jgi:hypothetical protein